MLLGYVLSTYSARKLGLRTTGNAGGTHNLLVHGRGRDFDQMLTLMDRGLYVTELMGQGVNGVTGDYSRGAGGFWVENGRIQYPVHEVTIAGQPQGHVSEDRRRRVRHRRARRHPHRLDPHRRDDHRRRVRLPLPFVGVGRQGRQVPGDVLRSIRHVLSRLERQTRARQDMSDRTPDCFAVTCVRRLSVRSREPAHSAPMKSFLPMFTPQWRRIEYVDVQWKYTFGVTYSSRYCRPG